MKLAYSRAASDEKQSNLPMRTRLELTCPVDINGWKTHSAYFFFFFFIAVMFRGPDGADDVDSSREREESEQRL